ncbi:MAG TPA: M48 family metallopeptidase [Gemmatimonadota bacterium]|nr:M48 family metallopeptidase [Gemmatimonadota bacterium]
MSRYQRPAETRGLYGEIAANRRRSLLLVVSLSALLGAFGAALGGLYGHAGTGLTVAVAVAVVLLLVTWFGGASMTLAASSARPADPTRDQTLLNVVHEMAIASGTPVPAVYVIDDSAPNAFATGRDPRHAMVAVTTGLVDKLDRDELQGVIAHELAHVRNYDIRYTTLVAVTVGAIALVADFALRRLWWAGPTRSRNRDASLPLVLIAVLVAILAPLSARLLQAAVSRRRETLADLGSAEMTRYPEALARALEKIEADTEVLEAANRATAPLYIVNPVKSFEERATSLLRTHPPTAERVRLLRGLVLSGTGEDPTPAS